jgi:hypothetical protein
MDGMTPIDELLAPGRALESLMRRAASGNRIAWRLLLEHAPGVIAAERRWLYPALLHRRPGGAHRTALMPFDGEHEQMLELLERLAHAPPAGRSDPMFRAMEWLVLRHARSERRWLERALAEHRPRDDPALARFAARCRPVVEAVARLARPPAAGDPPRPAASATG